MKNNFLVGAAIGFAVAWMIQESRKGNGAGPIKQPPVLPPGKDAQALGAMPRFRVFRTSAQTAVLAP